MQIRWNLPRSTEHYRIPKGEIRSDRKPGTLVWQREGAKIFVTCKGCNAINDITDHQAEYYTQYKGNINQMLTQSCFVCTNCRTHYYFELLGWDPPSVVQCVSCKTVPDYRRFVAGKGEIRFLRKKGWMVDVDNTRNSTCPGCRKHHAQKV